MHHAAALVLASSLTATLLAAGLVACTGPATLSRDAASLRALAADTADGCESLGEFSKRNTNTLQSPDEARKDALNKALNEAAARGATHVVLSPYYNSVGGACEDCAEVDVTAYRCDGGVADMTVVDAVVAANPSDAPPAQTSSQASGEDEADGDLPDGESNHDDHDAVCEAIDSETGDGAECRADTECLVCQSGDGCGEAVTRDAFVSAGAACAKAPGATCDPVVAYCCAGRCVLPE